MRNRIVTEGDGAARDWDRLPPRARQECTDFARAFHSSMEGIDRFAEAIARNWYEHPKLMPPEAHARASLPHPLHGGQTP